MSSKNLCCEDGACCVCSASVWTWIAPNSKALTFAIAAKRSQSKMGYAASKWVGKTTLPLINSAFHFSWKCEPSQRAPSCKNQSTVAHHAVAFFLVPPWQQLSKSVMKPRISSMSSSIAGIFQKMEFSGFSKETAIARRWHSLMRMQVLSYVMFAVSALTLSVPVKPSKPIGCKSLRSGFGTFSPSLSNLGSGRPLALEAVPHDGAKCAQRIFSWCFSMKSHKANSWSGSFKS